MDAYHVIDEEGHVGQNLVGPGGFGCWLGEPEDRTWHRDGREAVLELNRLAAALDVATAAIAEIREHAHAASTGPAVPDACWAIRGMCDHALEAVGAPS